VARGGALGLAGAAVSAVAGFVLVVVVTRALAPEDAGLFFAATAVFLMISAIGSLGTDAGLARFALRLEAEGRFDDVRRVIGSALVTVMAISVVAAVSLVLFDRSLSSVLGWGRTGVRLPVLFAVALPVAVLSDFALAATRAFGRIRPTVVLDRLLRAGGQALIATLVIALGGGLGWLTAGWLAAYAVSATLAVAELRRLTRQRAAGVSRDAQTGAGGGPTALRRDAVRDFWRFTWPRGLTRLAQIGIQKADIVLVAALRSPAEAAVYTAATRFVALGQFATQALQQVLQPRFTAILVHEDKATLREVYRVATTWNVLLTWPVYLVIGCAPVAYLGLFGGGYADSPEAPTVVVVMMLAMLLAVASGPVDTLLLMAGRSGRSLVNASVALAVDIGLCLLLLPRLGITGAALAWAAAVVTRCGLAFLQVRSELRVVPLGRSFLVAVLLCTGAVGLPMALASLLGLRDPVLWALLACLLAALDLALLWACRDVLRLDVLVAALRSPLHRLVPGPEVSTGPSLVEDPCVSEPSPASSGTSSPTRR
jgi:O-antigen/teichoic acid export membrane protein